MLAESLSICSISEGWLVGGVFSRLGVAQRGSTVSKRMAIDLIASAVGAVIPCAKVR